ncbi:MAG: CCA tRNA nucleotidyltransferase, partial [Actinomycetia bacterium]|nr:CCA tRNA nucleotidyltransferase [Actinomycetes bacterium]
MNNLPVDIIPFCEIFRDAGYEIYLVGGAVRDYIIRDKSGTDNNSAEIISIKEPDFDFATNGAPDIVTEVMGKKNIKVIPTGIKHGTVTVLFRDNTYEVTTYRLDGKYSDSRHPDKVEFAATIDEDLSRRDFTVNGIAYDPFKKEFIDNFNGIEDIERKVLRTIGDPVERFSEDALRVIRLCRFAAVLGFSVDKDTLDAVPVVLEKVKLLSNERIREELMKMMTALKPSTGIELMRISGILETILPELNR